jgi:hypothetical protein
MLCICSCAIYKTFPNYKRGNVIIDVSEVWLNLWIKIKIRTPLHIFTISCTQITVELIRQSIWYFPWCFTYNVGSHRIDWLICFKLCNYFDWVKKSSIWSHAAEIIKLHTEQMHIPNENITKITNQIRYCIFVKK